MDSLYTGIDYLGDKESAITLIFIFPMIIRDVKKKDNTIRKGQFGPKRADWRFKRRSMKETSSLNFPLRS